MTQIRFIYNDALLPAPAPGEDALNAHFLGNSVLERTREPLGGTYLRCTVTFMDNIPQPALNGLVVAIGQVQGIDADTVEVV